MVLLGLLTVSMDAREPHQTWDAWRSSEDAMRPTTSCVQGYYQDSPIVFSCGGSGGEQAAKVLVEPGVSTEIGIPKGTSALKVAMQAHGSDGDLDIYDPIAGVWVKDHLRKKGRDHWEGTYKHVHTVLKESHGAPTHEEVVFKGPLPTVLILHLKCFDCKDGAEFTLKYSYGVSGEPNCVRAEPVGCRKYDAFAARETAVQWSRWARKQFPREEEAWMALADGRTIKGAVPSHKWCSLWRAWPAATKQSADCKAVLKLISGSNSQTIVTRADFNWAYGLDQIATFSSRCCSQVRMAYTDEASAWESLKAKPLQVMAGLCNVDGQEEVSTRSWSAFMDVNHDPGMQVEEFHSCWMSAEECPRYTYYRTQVVLFHCRPEQGHATILLSPGEREQVAEVPEGLKHLKIGVEASAGHFDMTLRDAQATATKFTVKADSAPSEDDDIFQSARIRWSSSRNRSDSGRLWKEMVTFKDDTPAPMMLEVISHRQPGTKAKVSFSYDGFGECPSSPEADEPDVPVGCAFYNAREGVPLSCLRFSSFVQQAHPDADTFWKSLQENGVEQMAAGPGVPFFMWRSLWTSWNHGEQAKQWQECFHWYDIDHDGILSAPEAKTLYGLSRTNAVTAGYCGSLCHTYPNHKALWATWSDGAMTVAPHRWAMLWNGEKLQASSQDSFYYMDKDGDGSIDHEEFQACYQLGGCKRNWPLIGGLLAGGAAVSAAATAAGVAFTHTHWHQLPDRVEGEVAGTTREPPSVAARVVGPAAYTPEPSFRVVAKGGNGASFSGSGGWIWMVVAVMAACVLIVAIVQAVMPFFVRKMTRPTRRTESHSTVGAPSGWMQQQSPQDSLAAVSGNRNRLVSNSVSPGLAPQAVSGAPLYPVATVPAPVASVPTVALRPIQPPPASALSSVVAPHGQHVNGLDR